MYSALIAIIIIYWWVVCDRITRKKTLLNTQKKIWHRRQFKVYIMLGKYNLDPWAKFFGEKSWGEKNQKTIELENKNYFCSETTGQMYNLLPPDGSERQVQMPITVHHFNWLISQACASLKWGNRTIHVLDFFFLLLLVCLCPKCLADLHSPLLLLFHLTMCSFWLILLYGQDQFSPLFIP